MKYLNWIIILIIICSIPTHGQERNQNKILNIDPYKVLSSWTYEDVIKEFGEGTNIVDSMQGQAYIAGFRYQKEWNNRACELEFYFSDVDVSRFLAKFPHPNFTLLEKEDEKKKEEQNQDLLKDNSGQDSLLIQSLKDNPVVFDSVAYMKEFLYRNALLEKDSLRSDSIIRDISAILGQPIREGPTQHTEKESRYQATWIKGGYSCSLKDSRKFAEIHFGISPAPGSAIAAFNINPETQLIEKINIKVKNESIEIALLGLPSMKGSSYYSQINLMATTSSGVLYIEELPEERQGGSYPTLQVIDLTSDGIPEIWLRAFGKDETGCTTNFIYTIELIEPLMIFDPLEDFELELDGEFQDNFQAMVLIDGYPRTYLELDKNDDIYKNLYDSNGKLLKPVQLSSGCLNNLKAMPYKSKKGSQFLGYMPIYGLSEDNLIGHVQAIWDYNMGGWELRSLEISRD